MHSHIAGQALVAIGITQYRFGVEVVDESTYLEHCQEVVGVTTTGESILGTPSKDWATFKAKYDELEAKFPMDELRMVRNIKLTETDWTQNPDIPSSTRDKWLSYRQELRDFPETASPTLNEAGYLNESSVVWPNPPS